jgi:hypothetical protein
MMLTMQYVFYVDDDNSIRDLRRGPDTDGEWVPGKLRSDLGLKAAPYSKLAAITMTNRWGTTISIYYQANDKDASIKSANFKQGQANWATDTTRVTDPPLFGTSLSAVKAREGLQIDQQKPFNVDSSLPVVYLQWHSLEMAHSQGSGTALFKICLTFIVVLRMQDLGLKFAPHTSLTAIDDRGSLQYFYTSAENNNIKRVIFGNDINDIKKAQFDTLATPTPRSAITAVLVKPGKVVLFYQALDKETTGKVLIVALTLSESGGVWNGKPDRPAPAVTELR